MSIQIDINKHSDWPLFEGWLNELIQYYEVNALKPSQRKGESGRTQIIPPTESAISIKAYQIAIQADNIADTAQAVGQMSKDNIDRSKSNFGTDFRGVTSDARHDAATSDSPLLNNPIVDTLMTGHSTVEISPDGLRGAGINQEFSGDLLGSSFRKNDLVKWFADCFPCDGRITAALNADITLPEILVEIGDFLDDIINILDQALAAWDSGRFIANLCSLLAMGKWCIQDLIALEGILAAQLQQFWLIDPSLRFSWWGLISALLLPILQVLHSVASMSVQLALGPVDCLKTIFQDMRRLVEATGSLDSSLGMSLGHLQASVLTTGHSLGHAATSVPSQDNLVATDVEDNTYSVEVTRRLRGKTDWFSGDTLLDYSEVLNILSPVETALLTVVDFEAKIDNISEWLASKIAVLRSQSRESMFASLKFANVMLSLGRLWTFVTVIAKLIAEGESICKQETDSSGNSTFIPTTSLELLFSNTGIIPPWVSVSTTVKPGEAVINAPNRESLTIIDMSLNTEHRTLGCVGRIEAHEADKISAWMEDLDRS
jgi:hypothetical protein